MPLLQKFIGMRISPESSPDTSPIVLLPETSTGVRSCFSSTGLPRETQTEPFLEKCCVEELQAFIDKSEDALENIKSSVTQTTEFGSLWTVRRGKSILDNDNCPTKTGQRSPADILLLVASMRQELMEAIDRSSAYSEASSEIQLENEKLRQSLQEQIKLGNDVRTDVMQCLYETRALSQQSLAIHSRQIELEHRIEELQWETHDWESRCRRVEHPCMPRSHNATNYLVDKGLLDVNGAVKDIHVTYFQMSIDQTIHGIRAGVRHRVAEAIKQVVISVGQITGGLTDDTRRKLGNILGRVSLSLDSFLIESEGVDKDEGLRTLSRLEANASTLTTAIVDLLRMVKIKPTPQDEFTASAGDALSSVILADSSPPSYVIPASIQSRHPAMQDIGDHDNANPRFSSASSVYSNI